MSAHNGIAKIPTDPDKKATWLAKAMLSNCAFSRPRSIVLPIGIIFVDGLSDFDGGGWQIITISDSDNEIRVMRYTGKTIGKPRRKWCMACQEFHPCEHTLQYTEWVKSQITQPNNPMQATGLRPSDADGQSLSSDSSGDADSNNPPRA